MKHYVELLLDMNFGYGTDKAVRTHASKSSGKTFYLWFSVVSSLITFFPRSPDVANIYGASHGDDIYYLFRSDVIQALYEEVLKNNHTKESKVSLQAIDNISTIYTNLAKYGTPTYQNEPIEGFQSVQQDKVFFLDINNLGLTIGRRPNQIAFDFWESIEKRAIELSKDLKKPKQKAERNEL
ncbi:uncharacterized protein LOC116348265 [Contarinia nasturtii]|uniref:uncharacterized protein LOC116348265 n=1 Tax=Contarinia nasturtii TaxID=265458 RepID=UPI0012D3ECE1|nr:uncharacterized protein LOC116348265 [Contarinia nasturtii]XP_031635045.1 uncharacterized protein LOC116348265 [Contarinia nasturtii]XP_031635046.1 uncharacterized protein LOC116348265 [Contarinia nasturtii]XP_031635047.1 uncharacterized protein LOC116348265 [Contarinia nasturtii]XP_031635048.1 uncharacterized protein LOC116348265 [Contarinia nasturtii]